MRGATDDGELGGTHCCGTTRPGSRRGAQAPGGQLVNDLQRFIQGANQADEQCASSLFLIHEAVPALDPAAIDLDDGSGRRPRRTLVPVKRARAVPSCGGASGVEEPPQQRGGVERRRAPPVDQRIGKYQGGAAPTTQQPVILDRWCVERRRNSRPLRGRPFSWDRHLLRRRRRASRASGRTWGTMATPAMLAPRHHEQNLRCFVACSAVR